MWALEMRKYYYFYYFTIIIAHISVIMNERGKEKETEIGRCTAL